MTEAPAPSPEQTQTQAPAPQEPSGLEKVYSDFKIEDQAASFQPQPAAQPAPQAQPAQVPAPFMPKAPDPFDPSFQQYMGNLAQVAAQTNNALHQTRTELTQMQQALQRQRVEADIKSAVGKITEKAGIEPEIAEVALEAKARKDPRFLAVWNNRDKNPKAFEAAIAAVAQEFQSKYTVRQDPQLAENQRAVKASQQQMATTTKANAQDEWASMTPSERQAKVRMMVAGGH